MGIRRARSSNRWSGGLEREREHSLVPFGMVWVHLAALIVALEQAGGEILMIFTLAIECVCGLYLEDECIRVVEIDEQASLYDLHDTIQDAVEFDRDHLYDFYLANTPSPFAQKTWLTEAEGGQGRQEDYRNIRLSEVYPLDRKRLYYLFDYGDNWVFEIRKRRGAKPPEAGVKYPRVVDRVGPNPEQYPHYDE